MLRMVGTIVNVLPSTVRVSAAEFSAEEAQRIVGANAEVSTADFGKNLLRPINAPSWGHFGLNHTELMLATA